MFIYVTILTESSGKEFEEKTAAYRISSIHGVEPFCDEDSSEIPPTFRRNALLHIGGFSIAVKNSFEEIMAFLDPPNPVKPTTQSPSATPAV